MERTCAPTLPPRGIAELRTLISSGKLIFPDAHKRILEMGFARPDVIAFGNATSIGGQCGIAPSSVWRITTFLGFRSFREFKQLFRDDLVARKRGAISTAESAEKTASPHQ